MKAQSRVKSPVAESPFTQKSMFDPNDRSAQAFRLSCWLGNLQIKVSACTMYAAYALMHSDFKCKKELRGAFLPLGSNIDFWVTAQ